MIRKLTRIASAAVCILSCTAFGETYSWKPVKTVSTATPPASPDWKSFGDYGNWAVGNTYDGDNPDQAVPGADDAIYYGRYNDYSRKIASFDLGGNEYTVRAMLGGTSQWVPYLMLLTNGTLTVTESFTNNATHVHVYDGGKFVHGSRCSSICGTSNLYTLWRAYKGGELDIGGEVYVHFLRMEVEAGGSMTFHPSVFFFNNTADKDNGVIWLKNSGVLNIPGAVTLSGSSGSGNRGAGPCVFRVEQKAGTLTLGGNIAMAGWVDNFDFILAGGTVNVTNDVSFSRIHTLLMTNSVVVNVSAGKTFDLSTMTFASGTVLTKVGEGTVKFGASVPDVLNIDGGVVEPTVAVKFGMVSFAQGGVLHLGRLGVSAKKILGAANATITATAAVLSSQKPIFLTEDEADAVALAGKLVPPEGYAVVANGGTLTVEKPHGAAEFVWKSDASTTFMSFYNPANWGVGDTSDAGNDDGLIPGYDDVINHGFIYNQYYCFDMDGGTRWIKGLGRCIVSNNKWAPFRIRVKNGMLGIVSNFTNVHAMVTIYTNGCFVLGENCGARMGYDGNASEFTVQSGGECDIGGDVYVNYMKASVDAGGRLVFNPNSFAYDNSIGGGSVYNSYIRNGGTLELPAGIVLGGASKGGCTFTVEQGSGEMVLGGDVKMLDQVDYLDFKLTGGTVRVTADAAFVGCRSVVMTNDTSATANVADGKTFDLTTMSFLGGTSLAKTGAGTLKIGESAPDALDVQAGVLAVTTATDFGEGLSLGEGAELRFAGVGASAGAIAGIDDAAVSIDLQAVKRNSVVLVSTNAALVATVSAKLAPAVAETENPKLVLVTETSTDLPTTYTLRLKREQTGMRVILR